MPGSDDQELQQLTEYGYATGQNIAELIVVVGQIIISMTFIVLSYVARYKANRPEIKSLLASVPEQLRSSLSARWLISFLILPLIYWFCWVQWLQVPETNQSGWFYTNVDLALGFFYSIFSAFWLQALHQHWLASKKRPETSLDRIQLISVMVMVGFNKLTSAMYAVFSLLYAPIAVRSSLSLAYVFRDKQSIGAAVTSSIKRSQGHFWEAARLFAATGLTAYATLELHHRLDAVDFCNHIDNIHLLALLYASIDGIAAFIWILSDSLVLLRGLEYLELPGESSDPVTQPKI